MIAGKEIIVGHSTVLSDLTTLFLLYSQLAWAGVPLDTVLHGGYVRPMLPHTQIGNLKFDKEL